MTIDPVEAFLQGVTAVPLRFLIGAAVIFLALFLCVMSVFSPADLGIRTFSDGIFHLLLAGLAGIGMIFVWGTFGLYFFIGLGALIGMLFGLWFFIARSGGKVCLFAIFTFSCVYFCPVASVGQWYRLALSYIVILVLFCLSVWLPRRSQSLGNAIVSNERSPAE